MFSQHGVTCEYTVHTYHLLGGGGDGWDGGG